MCSLFGFRLVLKSGVDRTMDNKLMKLLMDKKVAGAYQYYISCDYKLHFAEMSLEALKNVVTTYQAEEKSVVEKVYSDAAETGKGTYFAHQNSVDFLGVEMSVTEAMDKLTMEIMGLLHNFFDTFAQWLNSSLLGEAELPIKKASLVNIVNELPMYSEYTGKFIRSVSNLLTTDTYQYISDFNNTLKHRYQIYVQNKFDLFAIQGSFNIPPFSKDGRVHVEADALATIEANLDFCKDLLKDSRNYIDNYYARADNAHVPHRVYNPKTHLVFKCQQDYENMRSPQNHYYYIEVDPAVILDEYQIMLTCDRMDGTPDERIECFNSPYSIVMLREAGTTNIVGILKPADGETWTINDMHELQYRKYVPTLTDFHFEMFNAICSEATFHYFPMLSDMTGVVLHEEDSSEPQSVVNSDLQRFV